MHEKKLKENKNYEDFGYASHAEACPRKVSCLLERCKTFYYAEVLQ